MKSNIIILFFLTLIVISCKSKNEIYYVIKKIKNVKTENSTIFYPTFFYGQHNFIIVNSNKIYYHNKYVFHWCGTGIDFTKPSHLYITPDSLIEIRINNLRTFLKKNLVFNNNYSNEKLVSISSSTDTIRNEGLKIIVDYLKHDKEIMYNIRNWTEEEKYVSLAKFKNKKYEPNKIKWKIGFDTGELINGKSIGFLPPEVK
jgi:hypothetical protein